MVCKLGKYFKQVGYRSFETSNDVKYCLFTHHNIAYPSKQECICCGSCCGPNGCNTVCCNTGPICGIKAISIWILIVSTVGWIYILVGISMFLKSQFLNAFLVTFYSFFVTYFHVAAGLSGLQLTVAKDGILFHELSHFAMIDYACLGGIYYLAFLFCGIYTLGLFYLALVNSDVGVSGIIFLIFLGVEAFISYLPFEAIKLIDSNAKWQTYTARQVPNAMDLNNIRFATDSASAQTDGSTPFIATIEKESKQQNVKCF